MVHDPNVIGPDPSSLLALVWIDSHSFMRGEARIVPYGTAFAQPLRPEARETYVQQ